MKHLSYVILVCFIFQFPGCTKEEKFSHGNQQTTTQEKEFLYQGELYSNMKPEGIEILNQLKKQGYSMLVKTDGSIELFDTEIEALGNKGLINSKAAGTGIQAYGLNIYDEEMYGGNTRSYSAADLANVPIVQEAVSETRFFVRSFILSLNVDYQSSGFVKKTSKLIFYYIFEGNIKYNVIFDIDITKDSTLIMEPLLWNYIDRTVAPCATTLRLNEIKLLII